MSREIKFRIWDNKNNEWLGASGNDVLTYYGFHLVGEVMTVQAPPQWALDPYCVVEQYTGLKDKNGKEIYEGDVVQFGDNEVVGNLATIIWRADNTEYGVKWLDCGVEDSLAWQIMVEKSRIEVIGNIHENPELLESEK